jgi:hypothetical protein
MPALLAAADAALRARGGRLLLCLPFPTRVGLSPPLPSATLDGCCLYA